MHNPHPPSESKIGAGQLPPPTYIHPNDFPTPEIAYEPGRVAEQVELFAGYQAESANDIAAGIDDAIASNGGLATVEIFHVHGHLASIQARGSKAGEHADRSLMPITDASQNVDTMGDTGRWREGDKTFEVQVPNVQEVWVGGTPTRATAQMIRNRQRVDARFAREGNDSGTLQNNVTVHVIDPVTGRSLVKTDPETGKPVVIKGNVLKRGQAFVDEVSQPGGPRDRFLAQKRANDELPPEHQKPGLKDAQFEINPELACAVTGTEEDRGEIREVMYQYATDLYNCLTLAGREAEITPEHCATIAYLITQAPMTKRGSDAAGREELMAILSVLRVQPLPRIPQDIDFSGYIDGQAEFIREFVALNS